MIPKSRIRLSRSLRSQITPYPNASRTIKRVAVALLLFLAVGIYIFARPKPEPKASPSPDKQILGEQEVQEPEYAPYNIKKGDTLFNLSQSLGISWQTLAEINNLEEPYVLKVGQEIKIPTPTFSPP